MPQLPSGRQVAILCQDILKMAELNVKKRELFVYFHAVEFL